VKEPVSENRNRRIWRDSVVMLALFIAFSAVGWGFLTVYELKPDVRFGDNPRMFAPAIGVAAGMGYANPVPSLPGLDDFLAQRSSHLDLDGLRDPENFLPAAKKFDLDRVYLLTAVGWIWRITGVRWTTVWMLPAIFFGLMAAATYGIFRLAARPALSLPATLIALTAPPVLDILPGIRDFCKGPFVLFAILFCGLMIRGVLNRRRRLAACAFIGLIIGIGIGFRQDAMICLPPVIACALLAPSPDRWRLRLAGVLIMIAAFLIPAWPVLRMNTESGGNNSFYLIQGFSEYSMRDLDLEPASYSAVSSQGDIHVHAAIHAWAEARGYDFSRHFSRVWAGLRLRALTLAPIMPWHPAVLLPPTRETEPLRIWSYGAEQIARDYAQHLFAAFPADVLTRAWGSVLRLARGHVPVMTRDVPYRGLFDSMSRLRAPLPAALYTAGPLFMIAVFLAMAAKSPWKAFLALAVTLFFLGYPSLSSQPRHVFHLAFAALWFPAFLCEAGLRALTKRREISSPRLRRELVGAAGRAALFLAVTALLALPPMGIAHRWQRHNLLELRKRYESADLAEIAITDKEETESGVFYRPEKKPLFRDLKRPLMPADILSGWQRPYIAPEYLVAELDCAQPAVRVRICYEDRSVLIDFITTRQYPGTETPYRMKLFVPVFGFSGKQTGSYGAPLSAFDGLLFNKGTRLIRLSRVRNIMDYPMLMTFWLPENPDLFQDAYHLKWLP
jgi:hypothetical protein